MAVQNRRVFYAVKAAGLAPDGTVSGFTSIHGLQSIGVNASFNLQSVTEIGQISVYENIDTVPEVEMTLSKVFDGYPIIYHLATRNQPANSLVGRSNAKAIAAVSYFLDTNQSASGDPISTMFCSGLFVSNLNYTFDVNDQFMEEVSLVGNSRTWVTAAQWVYTGGFLNTDTPIALASGLGGIQRRENLRYNYAGDTGRDANSCVVCPSGTVLPRDIYGISASGTNDILRTGEYNVSVQSIRCGAQLGRTELLELGHRLPYSRYLEVPPPTTCEIVVMAKDGDRITAGENNFLNEQTIQVACDDSFLLNMGVHNKLQSVSMAGGDAKGGNDQITYSYQSYSDFTITHFMSPA